MGVVNLPKVVKLSSDHSPFVYYDNIDDFPTNEFPKINIFATHVYTSIFKNIIN